jgi:ABC-type lipoprotein release transport system permease subunit
MLAGVGFAAALATILLSTPAAAVVTEIVRVADPVAYVGSLLAIAGACLLAAWIPAARAARLDPMRTLRQE